MSKSKNKKKLKELFNLVQQNKAFLLFNYTQKPSIEKEVSKRNRPSG